MKPVILFLLLTLAAPAAEKKVLVYTRNYTPDGKGYVHANIPASVEAIRQLGNAHGFTVEATDNPSFFTPENLRQYAALVFSNSNNEAFATESQRQAFQQYIRAGGGFVGVHSATGSERTWDYYQHVAGAKFHRHPRIQPFPVTLADPLLRGVPASFTWTDECYYHSNLHPGIRPLLTTDPKSVTDPKFADDPGELLNGLRPLAWYQTWDNGREIYIALGHQPEHYRNPLFLNLILQSIQWAMRR